MTRAMSVRTVHVELELAVDVAAHAHPAVHTARRLFEVQDVVAHGTVAVAVEVKLIAAQSYNIKRLTYNTYVIFYHQWFTSY